MDGLKSCSATSDEAMAGKWLVIRCDLLNDQYLAMFMEHVIGVTSV